jgi:hypothetical protein
MPETGLSLSLPIPNGAAGEVYPSSLETIEFRFFNFFRNFPRENPKKMVIKESAAEFL